MCGVHKGMMARQDILKKEGTNAQINMQFFRIDRYSNNKTTLIAINLYAGKLMLTQIKVLAYTQVQRGQLTNTAACFVR